MTLSFKLSSLPLVAVLALAGCANQAADQALYAQRAFVGMPKQVLLSCAGVPDREARVDNVEYYTYNSERVTSTPSVHGGWGGPGWGPYGWHRPWWGFDYPYANDIETRSCKATFTLKDGVVERVIYGGATENGSARLGQCYTIVQNCLGTGPESGPAPASQKSASVQ
jgi:hypothetical protein